MFYKILAAIDHSPHSQAAFDQALALAQATGANLMLLHVLSSEEAGSPQMPTMTTREYYPINGELLANYWQQWQTYEEQGLQLLRSYTEQANQAGVNNEFTQNSGNPGREICAVAQTWDADLIVMGRWEHAGLNELFLGSISNHVFHHAPCSTHFVHATMALKRVV
jgi:nucleotide-binding universal stress UspA family protein